MILENLKLAGVQQAHKEDRITFTSLAGWPGRYICAVGEFMFLLYHIILEYLLSPLPNLA